MTSEAAQRRTLKTSRDHDDDEQICLNQIEDRDDEEDHRQIIKAKRHDIEVPISEVDMKLVKKLDSILNISDTRKPRFFTNKPKDDRQKYYTESMSEGPRDLSDKIPLKHKNLSKEQLKQRLLEKYETLVPELDPKRPTVNVVKVLSATESLELAKGEAKKQMENQLELSSMRSNQLASRKGINSFQFRDNDDSSPSEGPISVGGKPSGQKGKSVSFAPNEQNDGVMATVKFFKPDENEASSSRGWLSFHSHFTAHNNEDDDEDDEDDDEEEEDDDDDEDEDDDDDDGEDNSDDGNHGEDEEHGGGGGIGIYMSKPGATRKPK